MPNEDPVKPRIRVSLHTPRGAVHSADQSLPDAIGDLMDRCHETKDKHEVMRVIEAITDAGARAIMKVASSFLRSFRRSG